MSVKSIQVTMTGSAVPIVSTSTPALWISFQNNAAAVMRIGDSSVTASKGRQLLASGAIGSELFIPPASPRSYTMNNLLGWNAIGTNTQVLDVTYDDGM